MKMHKLFLMRYAPAVLFALMVAPVTHAATSPSLGAADSYSVLSGTQITNSGNTTISGDVGTDPASGAATGFPPGVVSPPGAIHNGDTSAHNAQVAQKAVFDNSIDAVSQPCTTGFTAMAPSLNGLVLDPGVYCTPVDFTLSGTLTLHGTGDPTTDVWIFRAGRNLIVSGGSAAKVIFSGTGGLACNVWWRVFTTATFDGANAMVGNILASTSITFGTGATLNGRAFAYTAEVTLLGNTISGPTCSVPVVPAATPGSVATAPLINVRKVPTPLNLPAGPGSVTYNYTVTNPGVILMSNITLTDDKCSNVTYVSGDTNSDTFLDTSETWRYACTTRLTQTTVNYATVRGIGNGMAAVDTAIAEVVVGIPVVPPLIHIIKTPSPLFLPFNGDPVTYSYRVTNPGTVALTGVTVVDDKCSPVSFVSGDTNGDSILQTSETWAYTCTVNIPLTTVNTAIATGHANGLTAIDTAIATVVVAGSPAVPPLIHLIKKPVPVLLPAGGGSVTYTYTVTNPGTVALNNVSVVDDTCAPLTRVSGDTNGNGLMETTETWTYTCQQTLRATTTNTATATGSANGLTVTSVAVANVALSPALIPATPALPNTGFNPNDVAFTWIASSIGLFMTAMILFVLLQWKRLF